MTLIPHTWGRPKRPHPNEYASGKKVTQTKKGHFSTILSFYSISSFPFICYFSIDSSHVQWYHRPSYPLFSFISTIPILIPLFSILCIPFISFLRFLSSFLNHKIYTMFVRIVVVSTVICCVDRKHSQSIRRTCLCFWYMIPEQWHQMIRK